MATCTNELYNLVPTINSCPASNELVIFMNVAGQPGGYAARPWSVVRQCLLAQSLQFGFLQFTIGQTGSPITAGQTVITINVNNALEDSVTVSLDGSVLDRNDDTQVSYSVSYSVSDIVITLNQAASNNQTYIITYANAQ